MINVSLFAGERIFPPVTLAGRRKHACMQAKRKESRVVSSDRERLSLSPDSLLIFLRLYFSRCDSQSLPVTISGDRRQRKSAPTERTAGDARGKLKELPNTHTHTESESVSHMHVAVKSTSSSFSFFSTSCHLQTTRCTSRGTLFPSRRRRRRR